MDERGLTLRARLAVGREDHSGALWARIEQQTNTNLEVGTTNDNQTQD